MSGVGTRVGLVRRPTSLGRAGTAAAALLVLAVLLSVVSAGLNAWLQAALPTLAGAACLTAGRRRVLGHRSAWVLIGLAQLFNGVGNVAFTRLGTLWRIDEVLGGGGQTLFLAATGLELVALVQLARPRDVRRLAHALVEGLLVSAVLFSVAWAYGLGPGLTDPGVRDWVAALALVELVWGLIALGVLVGLWTGRVPGPGPVPLLTTVALAAAVVGDLVFAVPALVAGLAVLPGVSALWLLSSAAFGAAPWWGPLLLPASVRPAGGMSRFTLSVCVAGAVAVVAAGPDRVDGWVLGGAGLVVLLVTALLASSALENQRLTRRLAERERHFRSLVEASADVLVRLDVDGRVAFASPSVAGLLGRPPAELAGRRWDELVHSDDLEAARDLLATGVYDHSVQLRMLAADGREVWTEAVASPADDGGRVLGVRNVDERVRLMEQLRQQALTDMLTGLPNRLSLNERLATAIQRADRDGHAVGLLYCDLDGFKDVNDTRGHTVGDEVLRAVGRRLAAAAGDRGIVTRFGGDEFAVLVPVAGSHASLRALARDLVGAIAAPFDASGEVYHLALSVGVALHQPGRPAAELVRNADLAMFAAKRRGWGGVEIYRPRMHREVVDRVRSHSRLRRAVADADPELRFQPQVRLSDGAVIGFEALVGWRDPDGGKLATESVIELAETSGAIVELGARVLRVATMRTAEWRATGHDVRIAVNLSVRQLSEPGMVEVVERALAESGLPASALMLEVTETMLVPSATEALRTLERLRSTGVRLGVDDFGTGYSGLDHLRRLTVDELKVDRSFVAEAGQRARATALLRGMIRLGHDLGLAVVGEGVETLDQVLLLRRMGCDTAQGYLFSAGLVPAAVPAFLDLGPFDLEATGTTGGAVRLPPSASAS